MTSTHPEARLPYGTYSMSSRSRSQLPTPRSLTNSCGTIPSTPLISQSMPLNWRLRDRRAERAYRYAGGCHNPERFTGYEPVL